MSTQIAATQPGDYIGLFDKSLLQAILSFGTDELNLRSLRGDTPKYVLEAKSAALGGWSARYVDPRDNVTELALIQFKKDERTRGRDDVLWGEWTIHLRAQPVDPDDDGMRLVFLALHDYVWIKGISPTPYPQPPVVTLPPPSEPSAPIDDWLTPESQAKHAQEIARIQAEVPQPLDEGRVKAYMQGRNRNLAEVHDDELNRAAFDVDPCGGVNRIPL